MNPSELVRVAGAMVARGKGIRTEVFASALPSDPGLKVTVMEGTLEEKDIIKRTIFGAPFIDRKTGEPEIEHQRLFIALLSSTNSQPQPRSNTTSGAAWIGARSRMAW